ncbi:hypothetical protein FOXG_17449 [Fusarium oxysporum f. sp. lycopersici 4287]|uniref:Isotrichodermin C-15 hydroxylase n=2 Tax=Fusarium oxysporum f. sp. lycopersici (strain 4287 / CBS 123668 / FGSC 9935 / NRRL 34936) TaxID=426428 RepID=A0A0J9WW07_FUSO4|nr:hypothetical protein FOXG_17449 [Fusarium oxysporum f. sp. lycopersici 4287]EWZ78000.1 hypothetical protein FOWG_17663 [Fusarium oxysporum f. sp. lycopersici MN25]KAJ9413815.1 cytochrome P450 [Fusarium oxysporum]KNB20452.1 hypothetical protein FOXG_17449 [Fusarium oxysporum f. sp. lycopersici 4287]
MLLLDFIIMFRPLFDSWPLSALWLLIIYRVTIIVYRLCFHPLAKFPGPKYLSVSSLPFRYCSHIQGLFFKTVEQLHAKHGPVVRIAPDSLSIDGLYAWESIYTHKSSGLPEWSKVPGHFFPGDHNVLINAPRETHRRQRRAIAPAFSNVALNDMETDILRHIQELLRALASKASNTQENSAESIDIMSWLYLLTMDTVSDLIFSNSFNGLKDRMQQKFLLGFFDSTQGLQIGSFLMAYPLLMPFLPLIYMADVGGLKSSHKYGSFIEAKAKTRMTTGLHSGARRDFIVYMTQDREDAAMETSEKKGMNDLEISQNSLILATAGSDSTTTTMCGVLYYLAQPAAAKAKRAVLDELRSAFQSEEEVTLRNTTSTSLPYLNACIEEAMRVYPSTAEQPPRVSPGELVGGHFIPKGTKVYTYQWSTHRNPAHFAQAKEFHPERFLPESHQQYDKRFLDDRLSLVKPFSHGPRDCVGRNLAYALMRLTLVNFLLRFDYELAEPKEDWLANQTVKFSWTKGPLRIRVRERNEAR